MGNILKSKSDYIVKSLKNKIIRDKLEVYYYEWNYLTLELITEDCAVSVNSEKIADAWIKEIDKLKKMYAIS